MDFNFDDFEQEFNDKYNKRKEPPKELVKKWEENSKKFRDSLLDEEFIKDVKDSDISELEFKIMHTALLSLIPDMQTQIDLLKERIEKLEGTEGTEETGGEAKEEE